MESNGMLILAEKAGEMFRVCSVVLRRSTARIAQNRDRKGGSQ